MKINKRLSEEFPADKGKFNGSCNRKDCLAPKAIYFNSSTRAYYCMSCARRINEGSYQFDNVILCNLELRSAELPRVAVRILYDTMLLVVGIPSIDSQQHYLEHIVTNEVISDAVVDMLPMIPREISKEIQFKKLGFLSEAEQKWFVSKMLIRRMLIHGKANYRDAWDET